MDLDEIMRKAEKEYEAGNYEGAIKIYDKALKGDWSDDEKSQIHHGLARAYLRIGELYRAKNHVENAVRLVGDKASPDLLTRIYTTAINIYSSLGDANTCDRYTKLGMRYVKDAEPKVQFNFYNIVAIFFFNMGRIGNAKRYWEQCLDIAKNLGDFKLIAIAYNNLGEIYRINGERRKALEHYSLAYDNSKKSEDYRGMAINLLNMGYIERENGNLEVAERYFREGASLYDKHGDKSVGPLSMGGYSMVLTDLGRVDEAVRMGERALSIARESEDKNTIGEVLLYLGYAHEGKGELREAMRIYNEAHRILEEASNRVLLSECELYMGRVLLKGNMKDAARFHLERARKIGEEIGEFTVVQKANSLLAKC